MSSVGKIKAKAPETQNSFGTTKRKNFFFGVFFDGTGNNMIQPERAKN